MPETKEQKKIRMQKYYLKNKDSILEKTRNYRKTHKDTRYRDSSKRREYVSTYHAKHKDRLSLIKKEDREKNPEKYKLISKLNYSKNRNKILARSKKYRKENIKKYKVYMKKYFSENKEKLSNYKKERRIKFPELILKQKRDSYQKHKVEIRKKYQQNKTEIKRRDRERFLENPEKYRAYRREFARKFRQIPERKFAMGQQNRIRIALRTKHIKKRHKTIELLGCSYSFLRKHLESLFKPGMNWENHGRRGWHVDHIRPINKFDLSDIDQQKICFHYSNLQPLWWKENLLKSDK